ncbi:phage tail protein [Glaciibacter psychrotolerans]|uniref:Microcystin-dependent protein n=1 Tax=Glaciibacter psychrotolerans TaxID=670054 RepID=A0A7Z0J7E2_9MICO|nr:tail fiber protein [Leifsonia psychrotolerans]NYJ21186.1 microcystin-dependent protein [Leifsonia psychrotolerans]
MSEQFLGEIRMMSFTFAPKNWALCNGQLLPISQNQALFSLLGTTYGGNGQTTFALPNLQERLPMHFDGGHPIGQNGGEAAHILTPAELPKHSHTLTAAANADSVDPTNGSLASPGKPAFAQNMSPNAAMASTAVGLTGANQAHENRPPYLTLTFAIAIVGIFPSRN